MSIQFLPPNPEQQDALQELESLLSVLQKPLSAAEKQNIRFVRKFTKSLLIAGKNSQIKPVIKKVPVQEVQKPEVKPLEIKKITPLPPPPPPSPFKMPIIESPQITQQLIKENGMLKFNILEPLMEPLDWKVFSDVKLSLKQKILSNPELLNNESFLITEIKSSCDKLKIKYSESYVKKIKYYLLKHLKGYGKIDPLIQDSKISQIICDSYDNIKVIYDKELLSTNLAFDTNEELNNLILSLAEKYNQKISEISPELHLALPNLIIDAFYNPIMGSRFTIKKT